MSSPITIIIKSAIAPGKAEELKGILREVMAHCSATEPDFQQYDWYINEDESECCVVETYGSSEGLLFHFDNYAKFRPAMAECRTMREVNILGKPTPALRERLIPLAPIYYSDFISLNQ